MPAEVFWPVPVDMKEHPKGLRIHVLATIVATREDVDARTGSPVLKGMFLAERNEGRFKLWGSVPIELQRTIQDLVEKGEPATLKGSLVEFSAQVSRSDRDECFGFFMRPTKAAVLVAGRNGREA